MSPGETSSVVLHGHRIQAKADWKGGRFPLVPYETEFIPLPDA